jgi:hypothetical protein
MALTTIISVTGTVACDFVTIVSSSAIYYNCIDSSCNINSGKCTKVFQKGIGCDGFGMGFGCKVTTVNTM